jgi:hypothetical protein
MMIKNEKENIMITREFLAGLSFRVMSENDKMGFAGCESPVPLIAEFGDNYLVVIDGCYCEVSDVNELEVVDSCDDIRELPYSLDVSKCVARAGDSDSFSNLGV